MENLSLIFFLRSEVWFFWISSHFGWSCWFVFVMGKNEGLKMLNTFTLYVRKWVLYGSIGVHFVFEINFLVKKGWNMRRNVIIMWSRVVGGCRMLKIYHVASVLHLFDHWFYCKVMAKFQKVVFGSRYTYIFSFPKCLLILICSEIYLFLLNVFTRCWVIYGDLRGLLFCLLNENNFEKKLRFKLLVDWCFR